MRGRIVAACMAATTAMALAALPAPPANAAVDKLGFGFPESSVATVQAEGAKLAYSTSWAVGGDISWVDETIASAQTNGTTPVIHWYYWGDAISRACVDNWSDTTVCKDGKTRQKWDTGATALADKIHQYRPDRPTIVTLELEFHKGNSTTGLATYENLDGYLATQANLLNKYPNEVIVVLGWGEWATDATYTAYDRAQAASDWAGTQILFSCIRQPLTSTTSPTYYRNGVGRVIQQANALKTKFAKPVFVYDWAVSSFSEASSGEPTYVATNPDHQCIQDSPLVGGYEAEQNNQVAEIFSRIGELKAAEVQGFVFRALDDHYNRTIYNADGTYRDYHRLAERWFGFRHNRNGTNVKKPAWNTVMNGIKAENGSPPPPPTGSTEWKGEAEGFTTKTTGGQCSSATASAGLCWNLWANGSISTTTSSLTAGTKTVTVVALGDPAAGVWPTMEVRVDGTLVNTYTVGDDVWLAYSTSLSLAAGTHTIQVTYTNDGQAADGNDRNLLVDYAQVKGASRSWFTEAESFSVKTAGGNTPSSGASGLNYWNLWSNGHIENAMPAPYTSTHEIEVVARGDVAGGVWPVMKVYVDGTLVLTQTVATTTWTSYRVSRSLSGGSHTLRIEFTNDGIVGSEDRNLKLDYAALYS